MMTHGYSFLEAFPLAKGGLTPFWHFIGAFHPATTHLPIGLLMAAGIIEIFNILRYRGASKPNYAAVVCLCIGAAGSVLTAGVGWALRAGMKDSNLHEMHRWMGISLVVFSIVTAIIAVAAYRRPRNAITRTYQASALISAGLVGLVGMYGGQLSFGKDHYPEAWHAMMSEYRGETVVVSSPGGQKSVEAPTPSTTASTQTSQPSTGIEFTRDIKPIFDAVCVKCHGPEKQKGEYRLDTKEHAFTVGETKEEKPVVAGDSGKSLVMKVLIGEGDYEDLKMPPKGKPQPTAEQIATIKKWIDSGAQ